MMRSAVLRFVAIVVACAAAPVVAAPSAGSDITNIARLTDGEGVTVSSNLVTTRIAELLDIALAPAATGLRQQGARAIYPFLLTNKGNGMEAFALSAEIAGWNGHLAGFAIDVDKNGVFDPAVDMSVAIDGSTPALKSRETTALFALLEGTLDGTGTLTVRARAVTGSGNPGTLYPGKGDNGVDAIVGATTAAASLEVKLSEGGTSTTSALPTLVKTQSIVAADGSNRPLRGAIVSYTLRAKFTGTGTTHDARVRDGVPDGTEYVPGSITLDGAPLSDGADADAARFDGAAITVVLGDVAAPASHTILFKVKIK